MTSTHEVQDRLVRALDVVAAAWGRNSSPLRAVRPSIGSSGSRPDESSPVPVSVLDARFDVSQVLYGWCRVLVEDRGLNHAAVHLSDVPGMCHLLARHAVWLSGHEAALDMVDEIERAAHRLDRVTSGETARHYKVGNCIGEVELDDGSVVRCSGDLFAWHYPDDRRNRPDALQCSLHSKEHRWTSSEWVKAVARVMENTA